MAKKKASKEESEMPMADALDEVSKEETSKDDKPQKKKAKKKATKKSNLKKFDKFKK